jgi:hypothetical protein
VITFINFDGSIVGILPAGFTNASIIPGHPGNYKVGTAGVISSPDSLYDASGNTFGAALWTNFLAADQAIQFDQVVNLSGGLMSPLIRMSSNGQTGYGAIINWSGPSVNFVVINPNGAISTLGSPPIPAFSSGTHVSVKLQIQGSTLSFKCWLAGTTEPSNWTATATDSTYSAAGYGGFSNGGGAVDNVYFGPPNTSFTGGFLAPTLSSATVAWNSAQLQWTAASQSAGAVSYQLMRSAHGANSFSAVNGATTSPVTDSTVSASTAYDYKVTASDGINAPVNSNVVTLTTSAAPTSTAFSVTGPAWGMVNTTSSQFTVAPNGKFTGQITINPSGGGLSTPIVLTFANSSNPQTFTIDPSSVGTVTLASTNNGSLTNPSPLTFNVMSFGPSFMKSGQTLLLLSDETVISVSTGDDVQTINMAGIVGNGGEFTLSFNGQTTGSIAQTTTPPTAYALWTIPVTVGTSYTFALSACLQAGLNPSTFLQFFDGNLLAATAIVDESQNGTYDFSEVDTLGDTIYWKNVATFTPQTSSIEIYLTTVTGNGNTIADAVRVLNNSSQSVTYYDGYPSANFTSAGLNVFSEGGFYNKTVCDGGPTPGGYHLDSSAAAIQAALGSLSNIGSNNITVVDLAGTGAGPFLVTFVGVFLGQAQPSITSSDAAVQVVHTTVGGNLPSITVAHEGQSAGAPIPLTGPFVWGSGININNQGSNTPPYGTFVFGMLPQSAPDSLYYANQMGYSGVGGTWNLASEPGYSGNALESSGAGSYQLCMTGLPPATYQVAMTWIADSSLSASVPVLITDSTSGAALNAPTVGDSGFETPTVALYTFQGTPTGTAWTFSSQTGISANYSGFTSGGPNAPQGSQVAFIQGNGNSISQTISGWAAGTYQIQFEACQRNQGTSNSQILTVSVDGTVIATITPSSDSAYALYFTPLFTVTAGTHTIAFGGTATGDNTALIDAVAVVSPLNQSVAPGSGSGDFSQAGYQWRKIATLTTVNPSTGIVLTLTSSTGMKAAIDTVLLTRTSPDLSVKILPTDTVTGTIPAGFLTTASGPSTAFSGVIPFQTEGLTTLPTTVPTMDVGYNVGLDVYYSPLLTYADQVRRLQTPVTGSLAVDSNGYPTLLNAQSPHWNPLVLFSHDEYGLGKGLASAPYGLWTVQWTGNGGSDLLSLINYGVSVTEVTEYQNLTGSIKQRVFNVQPTTGSGFAPNICLQLTSGSVADGSGHYPFVANNFHIFPPNPTDPTGMTAWGLLGTATPPKFHPNFVSQLEGARCIRFLDWIGANTSVIGEFTDFLQPGMLFANQTRSVTLTPTTVTNYTGTALFDPTINLILEIPTPTPHGVFNLATVGYVVPSTINLSNSTTIAAGTTLVGFASPVSATVLQLRVAGYPGGVTMTNTVTGGSLGFGTTSPVPVADMIDLCNQVGADCWLQCPTSMTNSGMAGLAEYAATHLDSGLKLYGEFGNECWNYFLGSFVPCELLGYQLGLHGEGNNFQVGQVIRSQAYHQSLITAFTAVGRASDVVRVLGTQGGNPGITAQVLPFCSTYGVTFDVLAPAVYFAPNHVVGTEPNFQAAYDLMTPYGTPQAGGNVDQTGGQATDWYELMMTYGEVSSLDVTSHRTILDNAGLSNVKIACYEGGPDVLTPSGSTVNGPFREHAVHWHPRAYQWMLGALQQLETAGVSRFMKYYASGSNLSNGNAVPNVTYDEWSGYWSWNMVAGTGTSADTINASNPEQVDQIASETGAAMRYWNSLMPVSTTTGGSKKSQFTQVGTIGTRAHGTGGTTRGEKHI